MTRMSCDLLEQLQTIPDPRRLTRNRKHLRSEVLLRGFCGVLADGNNFVEIADGARHPEDFLRTFLQLPNGIPSHDTYNRVLATVRPEALQAILIPWLQQRPGIAGDGVPLDGKAMRGTRHARQKRAALHLVSAWASQHGLTLGQVAVDAKSHEITAIPQLLQLLDLRDKVVTIDAVGCQKDIAAQIVGGGGD